MRTLYFCVNEQRLKKIKKIGSNYLVANTSNYLQLKFKFSPAWSEYEKHIQFIKDNDHYDYLIEDDNTVHVPKLFVEGLGFDFLIVGYHIEEDKRVTTNTLSVHFRDTEWSEDITSYEDNTHDVYSYLKIRIDDTYTKAETDDLIGVNVKQALNLITYKIRTYGE